MQRLLRFRTELVLLWRAFLAADTPLHLKAMMLLVPLYLLSPIDLIPDIIPFAGWLDDAIVIPLLVSLIVSLLPRKNYASGGNAEGDGPTIDGTARRM